jgi:hypothetical protein
VAKREEMVVRCVRSTEEGEHASKNVNERSFMKRIVLVPFIGRVLSHRIASTVLFKRKPFALCKTPMNADRATFQP